jgi:ORF6N domain
MNKLAKVSSIKSLIYVIRGQKVMLDFDLGRLYQVPVKTLNRQVKRNISRFPADFMFQLTQEEAENLRCQFGTANMLEYQGKLRSQFATAKFSMRRALPYAFTRNGVNMLAAVLRSEIAIQRSIFIMRAFSALEETIGRRKNKIFSSPEAIKELSVHSKAIMRLFQEGRIKDTRISRLEDLQKEITKLIQKIIITSIEKD